MFIPKNNNVTTRISVVKVIDEVITGSYCVMGKSQSDLDEFEYMTFFRRELEEIEHDNGIEVLIDDDIYMKGLH